MLIVSLLLFLSDGNRRQDTCLTLKYSIYGLLDNKSFLVLFRCSKFLRALLLNVDDTDWACDVGENIDVVLI